MPETPSPKHNKRLDDAVMTQAQLVDQHAGFELLVTNTAVFSSAQLLLETVVLLASNSGRGNAEKCCGNGGSEPHEC